MNFFKSKIFNRKSNNGFVLIEVVVACSIISVITFGIFSAAKNGINLSTGALRQTQASYLLEEGAEAMRSIRDANWTNISGLTLDTTYYLSYNTNNNIWTLTQTPSTIDYFTRTVILSAVYRNGTDDIASSGTLDTGTKKVTVNVSWASSSGTSSKSLSFYIANIFN